MKNDSLNTSWDHPRYPDEDDSVEEERTGIYWEWLDGQEAPGDAMAEFSTYIPEQPIWVRKITEPEHADYEAAHMRHSIGHSWAEYNSTGDIYSLRTDDERPLATVMVSEGVVVHARGQFNTRLDAVAARALESLCQLKGWSQHPDPLEFDHYIDPYIARDEENTLMRVARRGDQGEVTISEHVLEGALDPDQASRLNDYLKQGRSFSPSTFEAAFGTTETPLEFTCFKSTVKPATLNVNVDAFVEAWTGAMDATARDRKSEAMTLLRRSIEDLILNGWNMLCREGALQDQLPDGWTGDTSTYYDGGSIRISVAGHDVATIKREVEYARIEINIMSPFDAREGRVLGLIRNVVTNVIEEQKENDRLDRLEQETDRSAEALSYIDDLPDPTAP